MNQLQSGVLASTVVAVLVAIFFFIPWRVDATDDLVWAPFYRNPVKFEASYMDGETRAVYRQVKGHREWGVYAIQLAAIGAIGWIAFAVAADKPEGTDDLWDDSQFSSQDNESA